MAAIFSAPSALALPAERFFGTSLSLLMLTSTLTLVSTGKLDVVTSFAAPLIVVYKGFRWWHGRPAELSHRIATWCVIAYLGFFPVDALFLSRFAVVNSANPPLFALLLGAVHFLLFGISTFVGMELRRGAVGAVWPTVHERTERDRKLNRALSLSSVSVATGSILLGGVLFFCLPRFNAGYLGRASFNPSLMSGFTENVELGQIGEIKKNSTVVMRVQTGKPIAYDRLRWRGIALTTFDGKRWSTSDQTAQKLEPEADGWIRTADSPRKTDSPYPRMIYTVYLEPVATDAIFVPGKVMSLKGNFSGESRNSFSAARRAFIFRDSTDTLLNPFHNYGAIRYSGFSLLPPMDAAKFRAASTEYSSDITSTYLQLPFALDPRVTELARQTTKNARTPFDKALAIETFLRTRYTYTLNLTGKPGDDPLAHFLFETRAGHCEYFASAMAIMLRTLGIPSREVNGFLPGEYNELGGDYIVRASDAHSWVEVYFPGTDWQVFDPTPAAPENEAGFLSSLGKYADWMEITWSEWVIGYDFAHQVTMAQNVQRGSRDISESLRAWYARQELRGKKWMKSWHDGLGVLVAFAVVAFLILLRFDALSAMLQRLWLSWQLRSAKAARANPQLASRLYAELLRLLARRGMIREVSQTPFEFAVAMDAPNLAPAVREFTQLYTHARFGGGPCDATRLQQLLDQIRAALRAR